MFAVGGAVEQCLLGAVEEGDDPRGVEGFFAALGTNALTQQILLRVHQAHGLVNGGHASPGEPAGVHQVLVLNFRGCHEFVRAQTQREGGQSVLPAVNVSGKTHSFKEGCAHNLVADVGGDALAHEQAVGGVFTVHGLKRGGRAVVDRTVRLYD